MPNHIHVMIDQIMPTSKIVHAWKQYTTKTVKALPHVRSPHTFWQRGYWDRYVRDANHDRDVTVYIDRNPVDAGLVRVPGTWPFGSVRFVGL